MGVIMHLNALSPEIHESFFVLLTSSISIY